MLIWWERTGCERTKLGGDTVEKIQRASPFHEIVMAVINVSVWVIVGKIGLGRLTFG